MFSRATRQRLKLGCANIPIAAIAAIAMLHYDPAGAADPATPNDAPYAITDPLRATVGGTPKDQLAILPSKVPSRERRLPRVDPARVPTAFFDQSEIRYALAAQREEVPLVFVIAGTGARYSNDTMTFLEALLYGAGFHVVSLSSPTHPDFILSAAPHHVPGYMQQDVEDLYALMQRIRDAHDDDIDITGIHVVGYSLGATEAAFLAKHDAAKRRLGFGKVVLLNPSVSLYESARILDTMFERALPEGPTGVDTLISEMFVRITPYVHNRARGKLDSDFLFHFADQGSVTDRELSTAIATVFRLALANMVFTVDACAGGGHVVEKNRKLTATTPLTDSFKRATRWTFERYVNELAVPYWQQKLPGTDRDQLIADASMTSIGPWLAGAANVSVVTNADDVILAPGHLDFLRRTFGGRIHVFPYGGHLGSLKHRDFAASLLKALGPAVPGST